MTATKPETSGPTGVTVGDFFVCSWGYDQTNVDFYKVVATTAKSVRIQKWKSKLVNEDGWGANTVVPGDGPATWTDWSGVDRDADYWTRKEQQIERDAPVMLKRIASGWEGKPTLSMNSYSIATLWDKTPKYETAIGWGH